DAVDLLKALRLLSEQRVDVQTGLDLGEQFEALGDDEVGIEDLRIERQMYLTEDGKAVAQVLSTRIDPDGKAALKRTKDKYGSMPLRQLLRYVYERYPDYASKSLIADKL
ncbi:MAG: hypothetical protein ACREP9_07600, partial [Candidatus Dormibacteraceae bacterium]